MTARVTVSDRALHMLLGIVSDERSDLPTGQDSHNALAWPGARRCHRAGRQARRWRYGVPPARRDARAKARSWPARRCWRTSRPHVAVPIVMELAADIGVCEHGGLLVDSGLGGLLWPFTDRLPVARGGHHA